MRKAVIALSAAIALAGAATTASADQRYYDHRTGPLLASGAVVGTVVGVGLFNGWWGSSATATALGSTAASSAVVGGVAKLVA
ncbi:MAG: hypothetical protein HC900_03695, partial [Methylacidiphilales bacterium]|nr:hypothetical protein [Candidatus Methylacidiphilales bacterium]